MTAVAKAITKVITKTVETVGAVVKKVADTVVDVAKYVAENPEVLIIAVAAPQLLPSIGVTGLAVQPVTAGLISASQGGDLEDIGKAALGTFIGQGVGTAVATKVGTSIGAAGNTAQTALANAVGGATGSAAGAVATGQDIGEAALMGAAGSAGASLARSGAVELGQQPKSFSGELAADIGEAVGRTAAGGDLTQELTSSAFGALSREGQIALDELKNRPETAATKQAIAAFSQPRSPGVGTQLGEATAELGGAIVPGTRTDIEEARRLGIELPEINMRPAVASDRELPEVVVTGSRIDGSDVRTGRTIPSSLPSGEARTAGTAGGVTTTPPAGADRETAATREEATTAAPEPMPAPEDMTGAELIESTAGGVTTPVTPSPGGETATPATPATPAATDGGAARGGGAATGESGTTGARTQPSLPPEEMTGNELLQTAAAGEERERLPEVEVVGEEELAEEPIDVTKLTDEELIEMLNQKFPVTEPEAPKAPEPDFKPLDVRRAGGSTRRAAPSSISPRVVGTSPTAAIVGQKEPIFGGEENAQQSVWNTRSLRLRKALGG